MTGAWQTERMIVIAGEVSEMRAFIKIGLGIKTKHISISRRLVKQELLGSKHPGIGERVMYNASDHN